MSYPSYDLTIEQISKEAFATNKEKGFLGTPLGTHFSLLHSEISEAFESYRKGESDLFFGPDGKPEGWVAELADEVIRICSLVREKGWNLEEVIKQKLEYNRTRLFKHGGKKF